MSVKDIDLKYTAIAAFFTLLHIIALPLVLVVCVGLGIWTTNTLTKIVGVVRRHVTTRECAE